MAGAGAQDVDTEGIQLDAIHLGKAHLQHDLPAMPFIDDPDGVHYVFGVRRGDSRDSIEGSLAGNQSRKHDPSFISGNLQGIRGEGLLQRVAQAGYVNIGIDIQDAGIASFIPYDHTAGSWGLRCNHKLRGARGDSAHNRRITDQYTFEPGLNIDDNGAANQDVDLLRVHSCGCNSTGCLQDFVLPLK